MRCGRCRNGKFTVDGKHLNCSSCNRVVCNLTEKQMKNLVSNKTSFRETGEE